MVTTKPETETTNRQRIAWCVFAVLAVGFVIVLALALRTPPQMGADEEVFNTVDALYTAVRNQDVTQLKKCEERLNTYQQAGKLPKPSAEYLESVIAKANGGGWQTAAQWLYDFMLAQRRDGFESNHHHEKKPKPQKGHSQNLRTPAK